MISCSCNSNKLIPSSQLGLPLALVSLGFLLEIFSLSRASDITKVAAGECCVKFAMISLESVCVLHERSSLQNDVFDQTARPILDSCMQGYNGALSI